MFSLTVSIIITYFIILLLKKHFMCSGIEITYYILISFSMNCKMQTYHWPIKIHIHITETTLIKH